MGHLLNRTVPLATIALVAAIALGQIENTGDIVTSAFRRPDVAVSENHRRNEMPISADLTNPLLAQNQQSKQSHTPFGGKSGYELVFQDEFDGASLNESKWSTQFNWGRTHNTHYMTYFAPDAFQVAAGNLQIKAEKRQVAEFNYTGGIITTFETFALQYGYVEMKAKLPKGKGFWPAFWLLPTSKVWPPEIDIFELLGHETNKVYLTNHWQDAESPLKHNHKAYVGADFSKDYHVFAIEWTPTELIWYIDGFERYRTNQGVPQVPMYLLAALTIGGNWPGAPTDKTPFPAYMDIDYIRVFKSNVTKQ